MLESPEQTIAFRYRVPRPPRSDPGAMREISDTVLPAPSERTSLKRTRKVASVWPRSRATVCVPSHTVTVAEERAPPGAFSWWRMSRRSFASHDTTLSSPAAERRDAWTGLAPGMTWVENTDPVQRKARSCDVKE